MIPWETIAAGVAPGPDAALSLHRRGDEWSIRTRGVELMNSRRFGSERALAERAAGVVGERAARVLVGGLGMGHTLAAALESFPGANVVVAEISASIVEWNRGVLGSLAGHPLADPRCSLFLGDVGDALRRAADDEGARRFDVILLDVDNGPEALSQRGNASLYSDAGIAAALAALAPAGVLGVWSAGPDAAFERRLRGAGCRVETHRIAGAGSARHRLWMVRSASR